MKPTLLYTIFNHFKQKIWEKKTERGGTFKIILNQNIRLQVTSGIIFAMI